MAFITAIEMDKSQNSRQAKKDDSKSWKRDNKMFAYKILNKRRNEGVEEETLPSLHRKQLNERAHWKNLNNIFVIKDGLYS